jgi:RNA polymerase sigma factor (sigma-70 family)
LLKQCYFILGNKTDAEEALSIAMMKLIGCWNEKQPVLRNPMAWVSIVVKNVCTDIQRQNSKRITQEVVQHNDNQVFYVEGFKTVEEKLPSESVESREVYAMIMECINNLPDSIMSTALMRFRDDLNYKDIAAILDIQENTARKRVEYARQLLMKERVIQSFVNR